MLSTVLVPCPGLAALGVRPSLHPHFQPNELDIFASAAELAPTQLKRVKENTSTREEGYQGRGTGKREHLIQKKKVLRAGERVKQNTSTKENTSIRGRGYQG